MKFKNGYDDAYNQWDWKTNDLFLTTVNKIENQYN